MTGGALSRDTDQFILTLATRRRWVISLTTRQFYPGERALGTRWIESWVGSKANFEFERTDKFLSRDGIRTRDIQLGA